MFYGGRASFEELYRELLLVKESKAELEKSRDEFVSRNRELELKYQDLLLELKQLTVNDSNKVAELECQLKLKNYELDRCSLLLAETDAKFKHTTLDNEKLSKKIEILREDLSQSQMTSEKHICALKLQLRDKSIKLNDYERLEMEVDKIISKAASLPDDDAEKILATYEKDAFISLNSKHRLRHSLNLARRILELENRSVELKEELFKERDLKQSLQQELVTTKSCLAQVDRPASDLINVVLKKDLEIFKLNSKLESLESAVFKLTQNELQLKKEIRQVTTHDQDLEVIKNMISELRSHEATAPTSSSKNEHSQSPVQSQPKDGSRNGFFGKVGVNMGPIFWKSRMLAVILGLSICLVGVLAVDEDFDQVSDDLDPDAKPSGDEIVMEPDFEVEYNTPIPAGNVYFAEHFDDFDGAKKRWIISRAQKEEQDNVFKYDGHWDFDLPQRVIFTNDRALILRSKAKHAAISAKLNRRFDFNTKPLLVQYEVNFQNGMDCGGAYIKLLSYSKDLDLNSFHDKTPYTIMFGPDKCGNDIKMHFIFRHKNPINGTFEEKHAKRPSNRMEETYSDKKPHLYRLILTPDNKYQLFIDSTLVGKGSLLSDMTPPVNPPEEIEDPNDRMPSDWDDREKIPDMTASKPEDWDEDAPAKIPDPKAVKPEGWLEDEPEMLPDGAAEKPEDWDESMDGSWEPPSIPNPKCEQAPGCGPWSPPLIENPEFKGIWKPPMISNPNYKGKWSPRKIPNPGFFEDKEPFKMTPIGAVGIEIWSMTEGILFDNFIITDDEQILEDWTSQTYDKKKRAIDRDSEGVVSRIINYSNAHPWLWALYIVVIGLPLVLLFTFCCSQDKKTDIHKKTDNIVEDDVPQGSTNGKDAPVNTKASKKQILTEATRRQNKVSTSKDELENKRLDSDDESDPEGPPSADEAGDGIKETSARPTGLKASGSKNIIDLNADEISDIGSSNTEAPKKRRARRE
ncbi:unnamed protein product [Allacma fusca]|uniref:Calnexin n=1 Tax=Allacma fusca TaxID=39272 RepID=A0A8J2L9D4_9HEXA|nr:unnamed protein product [Allacma fusca]